MTDPGELRLMKALDYCLGEFEADEGAFSSGSAWDGDPIEVKRDRLPLSSLAFICLVILKGYMYWGKDEKLLWTIPFKYRSYPLLLSHRKFGLQVLSNSGATPPDVLVEQMLKQLNKATKVTEKLVQPYADQQVKAGNVTIANSYHKLDMMYRFFRRKAKECFRRAGSAPPSSAGGRTGPIAPLLNWRVKHEHEGVYYSTAMIDAFFSRLEHVLVLVLPFVGFDPLSEDLVAVISSSWRDKFKRVFDVQHDRLAKSLYDQLDSIRERFRNPLTHGYFEKAGASLYFHMPGLYAVPVRLSKFREGLHYSFFPITAASLDEVCRVFDKTDALFRSGAPGKGFLFAKSGLDVAFDASSRAEHRTACSSNRSLRKYIEHMTYRDTIFTNMDW